MSALQKPAAATGITVDRRNSTITLVRRFDAPAERAFAAWTRPEHVSRWWDPAGKPLAVCEIDLRPGGRFTFVTATHPEMPFTGTYLEITPPERLTFRTEGMGDGKVLFEEEEGWTLTTVVIECGSEERLEMFLKMGIDVGTAATLDNLVAYLGD